MGYTYHTIHPLRVHDSGSSNVVQRVQDLALLQLRRRFNTWPGNFYISWGVAKPPPKKKQYTIQ